MDLAEGFQGGKLVGTANLHEITTLSLSDDETSAFRWESLPTCIICVAALSALPNR